MNTPDMQQAPQGGSLKQLLDSRPGGGGTRRWLWLAAALLVIAVAVWLVLRSGDESDAPRYATGPVSVGTLVVKVSATGNLQPTNQVEVGSELSGIVDQIYVDINDPVKQGQVLARLDLSRLQDAVAKSRAEAKKAPNDDDKPTF
jgi:HlyD family secretion protein